MRVSYAIFPFGDIKREANLYRGLDRALAVVQIVFGLGALIGIIGDGFTNPADFRSLQTLIGIPLFLFTITAGVLLWRGTRSGLAISFGLQLFQVLSVIVHQTAVRFVAGLQWTPRIAGPRIWPPWGVEGTFIAMHNPQFPDTMVGVNIVAVMTALYLASRLRDRRPILH